MTCKQESTFFFFLFHSTFPLQEGTLFLSSVVSIPHLRAPPFSSTEGSSIMPENQRWHTTPPSLKQTNPTVFTRSVFARYFLFSPTLQLGAKRVWVRWTRWISNDPTLYSPFGRRNSHGKLCLPRTIFQSQIDFKVSVYTIARLRRTARSLSLVLFTPKLNLILHDSPSRNEHGAPKILSMIYSSNLLFAGWGCKVCYFHRWHGDL